MPFANSSQQTPHQMRLRVVLTAIVFVAASAFACTNLSLGPLPGVFCALISARSLSPRERLCSQLLRLVGTFWLASSVPV
ncbi:hypothetical protein EV715DRAFT_297648 [Schizophyllum commune]